MEDLMIALKIMTPNNSKTLTEENKENIQQSEDKQNDVPMDVEGEGAAATAPSSGNHPEVEMVSDVDCSISEND